MMRRTEPLPQRKTDLTDPSVHKIMGFIQFIIGNTHNSAQRKMAIRVLETLAYIKMNPDFFKYAIEHQDDLRIYKYTTRQAGRAADQDKHVLRAPNDMAFHIMAYKSGDEAIANYNQIVAIIEHGIDLLGQDLNQINAFVRKFEDSDVGCMEARLGPVMLFISDLNAHEKSLDDLFLDFVNLQTSLGHDPDAPDFIQHVHAYFHQKIGQSFHDHGHSCVLTWDKIKSYLEDTMAYDLSAMSTSPLFSAPQVVTDHEMTLARTIWRDGLSSPEHYKHLKHTLPFQHMAIQVAGDLERANLLYRGCPLSFDVHHQGQWMPKVDIEQRIQANQTLFKMIDNWPGFLEQITTFSIRPKLRGEPKRGATHKLDLKTNQIIEYRHKRTVKAPARFTHTKKQSATLLSKHLHTGLFSGGVGLLFDEQLCDIRAMFKTNAVTRARGWIGDRYTVESYATSVRGNLVTDYPAFRQYVDQADRSRGHNEVLAKFSRESILGIFIHPDTPSNRKTARTRHHDLEQRLHVDYPLFFYDNQKKTIRIYTKQEQQDDVLGYNQIAKEAVSCNPMTAAINHDDVDAFSRLLPKDTTSLTPFLIEASKAGSLNIVTFLLSQPGVTVDDVDHQQETPLMHATHGEHVLLIQLLLEKGAALEYEDSLHQTALIHAVRGGRQDIVELLLSKGADKEHGDSKQDTAIMHAVLNGHIDILRILLDAGARIEHRNVNQETVLMHAIRSRRKDLVDLLLAKGADIWSTVQSIQDVNWLQLYFTPQQYEAFLEEMKTRLPIMWLEIKCDTLMKSVHDPVINGIQRALKDQWLVYKGAEADQKIRDADLWWRRGPFQARMGTHEKVAMKQRLMQQHSLEFDRVVAPVIQQRMAEQIQVFSPKALLNQLFERHPWVRDDPDSILVRVFMQEVLQDRLLCQFIPHCRTWSEIPQATLENRDFRWTPLDQRWVINKTEGHPLSHVQAFYLENALLGYRSLNTNLSHAKVTLSQWLNRRLTRVDVFRILASQYPDCVQSVQVEQVACTQLAPKHMTELKSLSAAQYDHFQTLFINIETEDQPLWIALNQVNHQWTAYIPQMDRQDPWHALMRQGLAVIRETFSSLLVEPVDCQSHVALNDINGLDMAVIWHAVLFGRVLPWCQNPKESLSKYRATVPAPLLLQHVLVSSLQKLDPFQEQLTHAFGLRSPMTEHQVGAFIPPVPALEPLFSMPNRFITACMDKSQVLGILTAFDDQRLHIDPALTTLTAGSSLFDAMHVIYHAPISRLIFTFQSAPPPKIMVHLADVFNFDVHLQCILPVVSKQHHDLVFTHASMCAARNRFMACVLPHRLAVANGSVSVRQQLWRDAGAGMVTFFQEDGAQIDLEFIDAISAMNLGWIAAFCDPALRGALTDAQWAFVQMAQMDCAGLDTLFDHLKETYVAQWNPIYKEPAPQLFGAFDLAGSATAQDSPAYIRHLTHKIKTFDAKGCTPLFRSLSLILPESMDTASNQALLALFDVLHLRKRALPDETGEVVIYHLDIHDHNGMTHDLLEQLTTKANQGFELMIRLPAWDSEDYEHDAQRELKLKYKALQNKILDNQRKRYSDALVHDSENMYAAVEGRLRPEIVLDYKLAQALQPWEEQDTYYPLSTEAPNIQQQMAQQQELQQALEVKPSVLPPVIDDEPLPEIEPYDGDESRLIKRESLHPIRDVFSLWVGSDRNAEHVIEQIEPSAAQKMMEHAAVFRLGIQKDNLPAGFYLAYSNKTHGLVLCFDAHREKTDQLDFLKRPLKQRNPFKVVLFKPQSALEFRGDFRQLLPYCSSSEQQKTLMTSLAEGVRDENKACDTFTDSLNLLREWAASSGASRALLDCLFDKHSKTCLTEQNLKALGQLFYQDDALSVPRTGSQHWLYMAQQILETFGPVHFGIWKERILDPSKNWSECLSKAELDAVALSLITLKSNPAEQGVWWQLVEAHGRAVGNIRYADVWYAYQKLLRSIEEKHLILNEESLLRYLNQTPDFNAQVFLDRLTHVLTKANLEFNGRDICQIVLNQVDRIDWRHSGVYYANRYEMNPYWDDGLDLTQIRLTSADNPTRYMVQWQPHDRVLLPITHALRFASQRMRMHIEDFEQFKLLLQAGFKNEPHDNRRIRLLVSCLAIGMDNVDDLDVQSLPAWAGLDETVVMWLNEQFNLDKTLDVHRIHLHFADIVAFANGIRQVRGLQERVLGLTGDDALQFINDAGRALHCYRYCPGKSNRFIQWFQYARDNQPFSRALLSDYPWLMGEFYPHQDPITYALASQDCSDAASAQVTLFQTQLRSIQHEKSCYWPSQTELCIALKQIVDGRLGLGPTEAYTQHSRWAKAQPTIGEENPAETRREIMADWVRKGCAIVLQDARFSPLSREERDVSLQFLDRHLDVNFKRQNLKLCQRFIKDHLAIQTAGDHAAPLDELMRLFDELDNKTHYNELGQILGLLMAHAKVPVQRFYSAPQLCIWLRCLIDAEQYRRAHYPIACLKLLLDSSIMAETWVSHDLNALRESVDSTPLQLVLQGIVKSSLLSQYKPVLVELALRCPPDFNFVKTAEALLLQLHRTDGVDPQYLDHVCQLITAIASHAPADRQLILTALTQPINANPALQTVWQQSHIKLMTLFVQGELSQSQLLQGFYANDNKSSYIKAILAMGTSGTIDDGVLNPLRQALEQWDAAELLLLARYYRNEPRPSMSVLLDILNHPVRFVTAERSWISLADRDKALQHPPQVYNNKKADDVIHRFESIVQAQDKAGRSLRHYSITPEERHQLLRVLSGIKRKGQGALSHLDKQALVNSLYYTNGFAQSARLAEQTMSQLQSTLHAALSDIKGVPDQEAQHQSSARVLACMREILLRKTGKWANHTQMLDLLYAARHNDDSLLHQVHTGEGKSIITLMRTAYLALNGSVVDVFSAKDSLSKRDHKAFAPVLNAMGIRNAYITAESEANAYHDRLLDGIGAVNYMTMGNFSLFCSNYIWKDEASIDLDPAHRVAFLDEADHVLNDPTQFNFSDQDLSMGAYNPDEWVYRAAYAFYLDNQDTFPRDPKTGALLISNNTHLKSLCESLQRQGIDAPEASHFLARFIIPALGHDPDAIQQRDNQLKQLLTACHTAQGLIEGVGFCIRAERKTIGDLALHARFAKVMIDNQIREGSTYSDYVQQLLHIRLNEEAASRGEKPDFFIEPDSQIALSQNAEYLLKAHYHKLEGCTGTAGNQAQLQAYAARFGISQVIKLPTHAERRSEFLPTQYCDAESSQIDAIVQSILHATDRPMLITCEDDVAVKRISAQIAKRLQEIAPLFNLQQITMDTNDSGRAEEDILPYAGRAGAVTISSRMGRGTDIKPETESGLMVLRTYSTIPSVTNSPYARPSLASHIF